MVWHIFYLFFFWPFWPLWPLPHFTISQRNPIIRKALLGRVKSEENNHDGKKGRTVGKSRKAPVERVEPKENNHSGDDQSTGVPSVSWRGVWCGVVEPATALVVPSSGGEFCWKVKVNASVKVKVKVKPEVAVVCLFLVSSSKGWQVKREAALLFFSSIREPRKSIFFRQFWN